MATQYTAYITTTIQKTEVELEEECCWKSAYKLHECWVSLYVREKNAEKDLSLQRCTLDKNTMKFKWHILLSSVFKVLRVKACRLPHAELLTGVPLIPGFEVLSDRRAQEVKRSLLHLLLQVQSLPLFQSEQLSQSVPLPVPQSTAVHRWGSQAK